MNRAQLLSAVQQMVGADAKSLSKSKSHHIEPSPQDHKIAEFLRANLESLEGLGLTSSNKVTSFFHNVCVTFHYFFFFRFKINFFILGVSSSPIYMGYPLTACFYPDSHPLLPYIFI